MMNLHLMFYIAEKPTDTDVACVLFTAHTILWDRRKNTIQLFGAKGELGLSIKIPELVKAREVGT